VTLQSDSVSEHVLPLAPEVPSLSGHLHGALTPAPQLCLECLEACKVPALFTVNTLIGAGGTNNERLPRETTGLRAN
ncbi:hypothetical protein R5W24_002551, partial [Gemmata sp. JC717]|uniref:hypothetical protein n=1 Tax=Gemmata algarum TaxID=2975278 RepID=UPI0021BADFEB